ncbi:MAG TPA: bifunctional precorrin-2 dehydrogenase/sirohydrochlorin ferrochelatase [Saprospiraceae bacterium]|mgnify:CR=1 FL=1|nr:bifunctional precorrin-2 dehydrogenase/sirohydrochlorin ferrochelatase [Saprospiraceae bacterium]HMQ83881.1 bifunctional precorrin-2 dehydrogenase/sirohydrochlorin ferrochelatase [Saprospiraceae bacterium]
MEQNTLYPIFLKLSQLPLLIVGAGEVGYEKLFFLLKSSPDACVTLIGEWINPDILSLLDQNPAYRVNLIQKSFEPGDVQGFPLVVAATNLEHLNREVREAAKKAGALVNVADTPALCDFYLGSIVTKGQLKVAISTNGQSPTFAKRFREWLEAMLPEETDQLLDRLNRFRSQLSTDFQNKVKRLNELTAVFTENQQLTQNSDQ